MAAPSYHHPLELGHPYWRDYGTFAPWAGTPVLTERGKTAWEFDIKTAGTEGMVVGDSGGVNGRILSGLASLSCAHCAVTMLAPGEKLVGTVELSASFMRPASGGMLRPGESGVQALP